MKRFFLSSVVLACLSPVAGASVFERPVIELLPIDEITADGARSYELEFVALDADGKLLSGLVVKPSSRGGSLGPATEVAPGHYRIHWTPAATTQPRTDPIAFRGKTPEGVRFNRTWNLQVLPVPGFSLALAVSPKEMVLGTATGATGTLTVTLTSASPGLYEDADLQFSASTGEVRDLVDLGGGKWSARFLPPGYVEPTPMAPPVGPATGTPPVPGATVPSVNVPGVTVTPVAAPTPTTPVAAPTTPPPTTPAAAPKPTTPGPKTSTAKPPPPPPPTPPDNAIIAVSDRSSPLLTYGAVAVPLVSRADVPVQSKKSAKVLLDVAGQTYGPVDADKRGKATIPAVMLPPGTTVGKVTTIPATGEQTSADMPLDLPPSRRAWVLVTPASIPSDPSLKIPLRVFVVTPDGKPAENAQVQVRVSHGQAELPTHEGGGIYRIDYLPPVSSDDVSATLDVFVDDPTMVGPPADTRQLALVGTRPTQVTVEGRSSMDASAPITVSARVVAGGNGLEHRTVRFVAAGASRVGDVRDLGGGVYEADFKPTGQGDILVDAMALPRAGANAVKEVLLVPERTRTTNDALDTVPLTVLALDEYGYPVKDAEILLEVLDGGGNVPSPKVTTDASGLVQTSYTPSKAAALVRIRASVLRNGREIDTTTVAILQAPEGVAEGWTSIPAHGNAEDQALQGTWTGLTGHARIAR